MTQAQYALDHDEVPVGCVIVHAPTDGQEPVILAGGSNRTNQSRNVSAPRTLLMQSASISVY